MAKKPVTKTQPKVTAKRTSYFVANHHTGTIVIPQSSIQKGLVTSVRNSPIMIPPGQSVEIDGAKWSVLKKNRSIQNYLDAGLLSEVKKVGSFNPTIEITSEPPVPEHLQREEEVGRQTTVKASVRRRNVNSITVE